MSIDDDINAICDRVAEVQAILRDYYEAEKYLFKGGGLGPTEVLASVNAILAEDTLLRAMQAIGYFPPGITP
jgi:hypothetical protein